VYAVLRRQDLSRTAHVGLLTERPNYVAPVTDLPDHSAIRNSIESRLLALSLFRDLLTRKNGKRHDHGDRAILKKRFMHEDLTAILTGLLSR